MIQIGEYSDCAVVGSGGVAERDIHAGSQGLQGGGGAGPSAGGDPAGSFGDREDHHGDAQDVVAIPIQALTVRTKGDLEEQDSRTRDPNKPLDPAEEKARREEVQGVFVVKGDHAEFVKVDTGIAGATDIEVLSGLAARRHNRHRQLQGHPQHAEQRAGEGGQQHDRGRRTPRADRPIMANAAVLDKDKLSGANSSGATASSSAPGI